MELSHTHTHTKEIKSKFNISHLFPLYIMSNINELHGHQDDGKFTCSERMIHWWSPSPNGEPNIRSLTITGIRIWHNGLLGKQKTSTQVRLQIARSSYRCTRLRMIKPNHKLFYASTDLLRSLWKFAIDQSAFRLQARFEIRSRSGCLQSLTVFPFCLIKVQ